MTHLQEIYKNLQEQIEHLPLTDYSYVALDEKSRQEKMRNLIASKISFLPSEEQDRLTQEFFDLGPLSHLIANEDITEIIVNGPQSIWFEQKGLLHRHRDSFFSSLSFKNCIDLICLESQKQATLAQPCLDAHFREFRLSLVNDELTKTQTHFCLRRHPKNPWSFERLQKAGWCSSSQALTIQKLLNQRKNLLIVGGTGSGKTSVLNSCLQALPMNERLIVIEDTLEIALPNSASMRLLTREDPQGTLPEVDQSLLVKRALRLRPDRIVMGEIRGPESKDFLMALSSGHQGSLATLHADSPNQALLRLEMLIQMGAPQWSLLAIRRLIQMSLDYIVVTQRTPEGARRLSGIYRLSSLEESGFLTEALEIEKDLTSSGQIFCV